MPFDFPNIRHMRVFVEAMDTGSVSLAAARCHLSQPAATQAISGLERRLGTRLLDRGPRSLVATEAGRLFGARIEAALAHLAEGARAALRTGRGKGRRDGFERLVTAAQLRALVAIANAGSFTVAARALGVSQPTVHRAARTLEALSGLAFFTPTAVGVELTTAAQAFTRGAKLAQAEIRQGVAEIGRTLGRRHESFVLGSLPLARTSILPQAVASMIAVDDSLQVRVIDGRYAELLRGLREGDLDCMIGALRSPAPAEDVIEEPLFRDELAIVAHPSHPLFDSPAPTVEDTLAFPWVAPPRDTPAGSYLFDTLRIQDRPRTPVRVVASSLIFLRELLARGPYVSIISRHQIAPEQAAGQILPLPIPLDGGGRDIGLTTRRGWRPTATQAQFIGFLRQSVRDQVRPASG